MNVIYIVGFTTKDFEGSGNAKRSCIKSKRNSNRQCDYFDVVAFKENTQLVKNIKANSKVAIEGTLTRNLFEDKAYYSIVISEIKVLAKPTEYIEEEPQAPKEVQEAPAPVEVVEDDVPF